MGVTMLMALVARPAVGLEVQCRRMLQHPRSPECWQPPGVPDATAGVWPVGVVERVANMVSGLTEKCVCLWISPWPRVLANQPLWPNGGDVGCLWWLCTVTVCPHP